MKAWGSLVKDKFSESSAVLHRHPTLSVLNQVRYVRYCYMYKYNDECCIAEANDPRGGWVSHVQPETVSQCFSEYSEYTDYTESIPVIASSLLRRATTSTTWKSSKQSAGKFSNQSGHSKTSTICKRIDSTSGRIRGTQHYRSKYFSTFTKLYSPEFSKLRSAELSEFQSEKLSGSFESARLCTRTDINS